jgi:hypothetical protein
MSEFLRAWGHKLYGGKESKETDFILANKNNPA